MSNIALETCVLRTNYHSTNGMDDIDIIIGRFWTVNTSSIQIGGIFCVTTSSTISQGHSSSILTYDYHWDEYETRGDVLLHIGGDYSSGMMTSNQRGINNGRTAVASGINTYTGSPYGYCFPNKK